MAYTYDPIFAADPSNAANVASNAAITLFDPADVGMAPITITDVTGSPLSNPITVNKNGFGPAFVADIDRVGWHGASFTGYFTSYEGMKTEATEAKVAAQSAASNAGAAAAAEVAVRIANGEFTGTPGADGSNVLPTDTAIKNAITDSGSETRVALDSTIATAVSVQAVPKWKANTAYGTGEIALSPNNQIVAARTAFTTGATYDASKWNLSRPDIVAGASGVVDPVPYRRWHAALANRHFAPAKWLRLGHSFSEGTGATALGNRWIDRSRDLLRQRFPVTGVTGGVGYLPPYFVTPSITDPARSGGTQVDGFGPGGRCLYIPTGIELAIPNLTGTAIDIMYVKGVSTGAISWRIDAGATTSFATSDAAAGSGKDGNFQRIAMTGGPHTLTLGCSTAASAAYVTGIVVYNGDENAGIQVYDAAHHGWKASDFTANLTVAAAGGDMRALWNINPHLVTIELGINEWTTNVSPATFDTKLRDVIWYVKNSAAIAPSIALILDYEDIGFYNETWQTFVDITRQAALDNGCAVIDLNTRIESAKLNTFGQTVGDGHPSNLGHSLMADSIVSAISPK